MFRSFVYINFKPLSFQNFFYDDVHPVPGPIATWGRGLHIKRHNFMGDMGGR